MKKSVRSVISKFGFIAIALSLNFFSACEIGLGSSVDVEAPKIEFSESTVESGAVVRDAFAVFGSWNDDGSIGSITATLKNLSTGAEFSKTGTVGENSWNVSFNPASESIPDGSYELSVVIKDSADHETKISRAFVIDNTAPLVVLSRPSTRAGAATFDSYGQKFTIEGKAADDNDVSLIEVAVYDNADCTGNPLKVISLPNVPLTIESDVATFSSTVANDYSAIYGHTNAQGISARDGGTEQRYCKLVVYDGAQRFPVDGSAQTEADKKGNKVDYYYLNSDFAQLFTDGYKITELYHILNGTYSSNNSRTVSTTDVVTNYLNNPSMHITKGQFKLNPENSPHFVVSARNKLESGHTLDESPLTNGNTRLEVEISPGLDGHLLKKDTIGVYLVCCDLYGNPLKEVNDPNSTSTPPAKMLVPAESETEAKKIWLIPVNDPATAVNEQEAWADITESGSTYKFKTKYEIGNGAYEEMEVGQNYYVGVTGQDMQPNDIMPDGLYGFQLITSGLNIEVGTSYSPTWLSWASGAATANKSVTVRLTYPTDNRPFEIKRGSDSSNLSTLPGATGINASPYNDSFDITSENHPTSLVYKVSGNNSAESNPKTVTFKYDNTPPQAAITSVPDTTDTQQGTITFKGTASDIVNGEEESGVKTVYVQVIDKTDTSHKTPEPGTSGAIPPASYSGGEWLCQVTPSDYAGANNGFAEEGPKTLKITVVDGVGLKTERTQDFIYDTAVPKITLGKYKQYGETGEGTAFGDSRSLLVGKTFTVNGTLVERYGLNATNGFVIEQKWTKFGSSSVENTKKKDITPAADGNWSVTLPFNGTDGTDYDNNTIVGNHSADGTYTYTISAKDKAGKSDNDGIQFSATLKTDGPNITISSPVFETVEGCQVTKNWQKSKDIMISGKASSPAAVSKVYWTTDSTKTEGGEWTDWEEAEGAENWNFTVSVETDAADHKVYIAAIDTLGNFTSKKEYTLKVDSSAPNVAPKFFQIGSGEVQTANGTIYISKLSGNAQNLTVYGTYSETVSGPYDPQTGDTLKPLAFTIDGTAKTATITYSNTDISSGIGSANFDAATPSLTTQSWKAVFANNVLSAGGFVVTARNGAGLSKENSDLTINEDSSAPQIGASIIITNSSFKETITENSEAVDYYYVNNKTTPVISGTASDANLLSVAVKAECTGKTTINKNLNNNPFNWSFELKDGTTNDMKDWTNAANGSSQTKVTLTVTDKAGNKTEKKLKFIFDTTPPLAKHEWDNKDKDLIFRIGEANNVLTELSAWNSSITALDDVKDKNVGGKYKNGTYGNSETIRIRGAFEDSGSGVDTIYYKKFTSEPTEAQINDFIANPDTQKTGNAIKPKSVTQRISFTNSSNNREFKEVERTFTELISDLTANDTNYIVVLAVDKVGNIGLDYAEKSNYDGDSSTNAYRAKNIKNSYYTLNIDTIVPENTVDSTVDTNGYVNPETTSAITISGVVNSGKLDDGTAPVKAADAYIELKVNGKRILTSTADDYTANQNNGVITLDTTTSSYSKTNAHWTATIAPSVVFNGVNTGSYPVYAIVSDGAGNNQTLNVASIKVDKTNPTVNINTISDADKDTVDDIDVNGELIITGTASDTDKLSSVTVEYKKSSDTEWATKTQETDSTPSNWKVKFDTTSLDNTTSYDIRVTATDGAGNSTSDTKTIYVNQDSDRPVIKFTNLTSEGDTYILKYGTDARLEGTIADDDSISTAVVDTFLASTTAITDATGWTETPADSGTWVHATYGTTVFNKATGDYIFTPADTDDGSKTIYFYVKDNEGKEFYTNTSTATGASLTRPFQQYKTDTKVDNSEALTYKSDSNAPTINFVELQAWKNNSGTTDADKNDSATALGSGCIVGGSTKNYVELTVSAKDGNGIKGIVIELSQDSVTARYRSNESVGTGTFEAENTGSESATTDISTSHVYTIPRLDLASAGFTQDKNSAITDIKEGKVNVRVYVYDNSGLYSNQESLFVVDKTPPVLNITAPRDDGEVVYAIQSNTVGGNVEATDVSKIEYTVTLSATQPTTGWNEVTNARLSASLIFDNAVTSTENGFHSRNLREWLKELKGQTDEQMNAGSDALIDTYIHFKVTDECGNAGYSYRKLCAYPNGDKPSIDLVYPEDKADHSAPSLAGTIRVYGYASVAIGTITGTYIQIDPSFEESSGFSSNWETELASVTSGKANYVVEAIPDTNPVVRGIKANGTQNWNLPINGNNEFNPTGNDSRKMAIKIYAQSDSKKISEPFLQKFEVDPNAPHIGGDGTKDALTDNSARQYSLQIVDFDDATAAQTITNYKNPVSYKTEMWVKGQKYLIASVYDDSGIKALTLNENISGVEKINLVSFTGTGVNKVVTVHQNASLNSRNGGGHITVTESPCGYTGKRNINIVIPLPTNTGSGSINWQLEATEDGDNNNSCTETIKINYDNAAPRLGITTHDNYLIDADIHQSNGFYTFKGYATDAEGDSNVSGMRGIAFYFMRRGTAAENPVTKVYDPMLQNNSVAVRTGSTDATGIIYSHGLYWKTKTVTRDSNNLKKLIMSAVDANIHAGGLALVGGNIYRIESVDGVYVTLEDEVPTSQTTANFALALVVDNLSKKETVTGRTKITTAGYGYGYYSESASADDGDLMQEDWEGTSIEGQWTAIINSANIPDGPIELHYVAFDKSQNYAVGIVGNVNETTYNTYGSKDVTENKTFTGTIDSTNKLATKYYYTYDSTKPAYISNNAPRIAGVTVGTDYNGDGNITDGSVVSGVATLNEKRSKYSGEADRYIGGTATSYIQKKATGDQLAKEFLASSSETTPMMVIKDKMSVDIEIIGGNGDLYYRYKVGTGDWNNGFAAWVAGTDYTRNTNEGLTGVDEFSQKYYQTTAMPTLEFDEDDIKDVTSADGTVLWTFEIWDSTEERTYYVDSQNAVLKIPLDIQIRDGLRPNTVVSDLYWNSATDNSVYLDVNNKPHGHVELVQDLTGTDLATTYGSTDDKVSGVVVFRGFAYDNKRLSQIDWAIVNSAGKSILPNNASGIEYQTGPTFTDGAWSNGGSTGDLAYNATTKTMTGTYKFTIKTAATDGAYLDEKGHKVAWELAVDTSKINGVVASDAKLYVRAKDTSGSATTQYTDMTATGSAAADVTDQEAIDKATKKPTYQVDILPYITNVKTWLSKKNKSNPTVYSRTAKGHYPIASSETATGSVMLQGYNLAAGNADVDISEIIANRTTGAYAYTVSGTITSINNMNNNDAHGDYDIAAAGLEENTKVTNMYNRTPNTVTNLTLNDDVYFDMWEFKKAAAPKSGKINEPVMRINPTNDMIGFAFANGADALSLPNGSSNSYTAWQKNYADYSGINFVYDSSGRVHSISTGLDTEPNAGYAGYMQYILSAWGKNGINNLYNWHGDATAALESVGIPSGVYVNGTALTANLIDVDRFGKPAIAVAGTNRVYVAYYDGDNDQIRFRYGTVQDTKTGRTDQNGQLSDDKSAAGTLGDDPHNGGNQSYGYHKMFEAHTAYYSLLAGKTQGATQTDTGNGTSEFVALDVVAGNSATNDKVVIVWYDGSDLMYTYREGTKDDTDCSSNGVTGKWSKPQVIFEGAGQYCTIKVDKNSGIHIAAYNRSGADLYYCYMSGYDQYANRKTALIDSYSQVGKYISIDTALVLREGSTTDYNVVPYITYYGDGFNGLPKLAYLSGGINKDAPVVPNGATDADDLFTGSWEVSLIPTGSEVNEDNMNVALWKTNIGVLKASTKPARDYTEPTNIAAGSNETIWYGNGSSKLVIGYGITDGATGFIEIAQMKN